MTARTFWKLALGATLTLQAQVYLRDLKGPGHFRITFSEISEADFRRLADEPWETIHKDTTGIVVKRLECNVSECGVYVWCPPQGRVGVVDGRVRTDGGLFPAYTCSYKGYIESDQTKIPVFGMSELSDQSDSWTALCFGGYNCEVGIMLYDDNTPSMGRAAPGFLFWKNGYVIWPSPEALWLIKLEEIGEDEVKFSYGVVKWRSYLDRIGAMWVDYYIRIPYESSDTPPYFGEPPKIYSVKGSKNACVMALAARPRGDYTKYIQVRWQ